MKSFLERRIEKLEGKTVKEKPGATIIYIGDKDKAIAEYKAKHPEYEPSNKDIYVSVVSERAKELTERLIAGE